MYSLYRERPAVFTSYTKKNRSFRNQVASCSVCRKWSGMFLLCGQDICHIQMFSMWSMRTDVLYKSSLFIHRIFQSWYTDPDAPGSCVCVPDVKLQIKTEGLWIIVIIRICNSSKLFECLNLSQSSGFECGSFKYN